MRGRLNLFLGRLGQKTVMGAAQSAPVHDRIVLSNGVDLAVALRVQPLTRIKPRVVAKVQGAAAVAVFVSNAEKLYQRVYDHPGLTRLMFDSVPLLQSLSDDLQFELIDLCGLSIGGHPPASDF